MLKVDPRALDAVVEALMVAAVSAVDQSGLRVIADVPRLSHPLQLPSGLQDDTDWQRIRAIALGAIVALVNGAAHPSDEIHLPGDFLRPAA